MSEYLTSIKIIYGFLDSLAVSYNIQLWVISVYFGLTLTLAILSGVEEKNFDFFDCDFGVVLLKKDTKHTIVKKALIFFLSQDILNRFVPLLRYENKYIFSTTIVRYIPNVWNHLIF